MSPWAGRIRSARAGSSRRAGKRRASRRRYLRGSGRSHAILHGVVEIAVGVVAQQMPDVAPSGSKADCVPSRGRVEKKGQNRVLADIAGDILFGVIGPHLLLVDILLKDIAQHIGVNLVISMQRAVVEMPVELVEEVKDVARRLCRVSGYQGRTPPTHAHRRGRR